MKSYLLFLPERGDTDAMVKHLNEKLDRLYLGVDDDISPSFEQKADFSRVEWKDFSGRVYRSSNNLGCGDMARAIKDTFGTNWEFSNSPSWGEYAQDWVQLLFHDTEGEGVNFANVSIDWGDDGPQKAFLRAVLRDLVAYHDEQRFIDTKNQAVLSELNFVIQRFRRLVMGDKSEYALGRVGFERASLVAGANASTSTSLSVGASTNVIETEKK